MLENHKCHHPARPQGGRGGKQKADAVKLVVCIGGGDHVQAINQQTKTSLIVTEQIAREPQVPAPHRTTGGKGGENRSAVSVCFGGGCRCEWGWGGRG